MSEIGAMLSIWGRRAHGKIWQTPHLLLSGTQPDATGPATPRRKTRQPADCQQPNGHLQLDEQSLGHGRGGFRAGPSLSRCFHPAVLPGGMRRRVIRQSSLMRPPACLYLPTCLPVRMRRRVIAQTLLLRFCASGLLPACAPVFCLPRVIVQAPRLRPPTCGPLPTVSPFRVRRRVIRQSVLRGLSACVPLPAVLPVRCLRRVKWPSPPLRLRARLILPVRHCPGNVALPVTPRPPIAGPGRRR